MPWSVPLNHVIIRAYLYKVYILSILPVRFVRFVRSCCFLLPSTSFHSYLDPAGFSVRNDDHSAKLPGVFQALEHAACVPYYSVQHSIITTISATSNSGSTSSNRRKRERKQERACAGGMGSNKTETGVREFQNNY